MNMYSLEQGEQQEPGTANQVVYKYYSSASSATVSRLPFSSEFRLVMNIYRLEQGQQQEPGTANQIVYNDKSSIIRQLRQPLCPHSHSPQNFDL